MFPDILDKIFQKVKKKTHTVKINRTQNKNDKIERTSINSNQVWVVSTVNFKFCETLLLFSTLANNWVEIITELE